MSGGDFPNVSPEYLAGLFDGEGTVVVKWSAGRSVNSLIVALEITNTFRAVIDAVQHHYGGRVYEDISPSEVAKLKARRIRFTGEEADVVAAAMLPFSIIKREQLVIFGEARRLLKPRSRPRVRLSGLERIQRQAVIDRLCKARKTGTERRVAS